MRASSTLTILILSYGVAPHLLCCDGSGLTAPSFPDLPVNDLSYCRFEVLISLLVACPCTFAAFALMTFTLQPRTASRVSLDGVSRMVCGLRACLHMPHAFRSRQLYVCVCRKRSPPNRALPTLRRAARSTPSPKRVLAQSRGSETHLIRSNRGSSHRMRPPLPPFTHWSLTLFFRLCCWFVQHVYGCGYGRSSLRHF